MRISEQSLSRLQTLLKQHTGNDYDTERAQAVGRAVLRLVGIKLYEQFEKGSKND